ncbi:hypothetical protein D3C73_1073320 [compost metagenome]
MITLHPGNVIHLEQIIRLLPGSKSPFPGIDEIGGCQLLAVAPFGIRPQLECIGLTIRSDCPGLGHTGNRLAVLVQPDQSLIQPFDDGNRILISTGNSQRVQEDW